MYDRPLKILYVSAEVVPFAKTGGLADVAGSLPKALSTVVGQGLPHNDVRVVMPRYKMIEEAQYVTDFPVWFNGRNRTTVIKHKEIEAHYEGAHDTIPVYMIDNYHYYYRDRIYVYDDEAERYAYFCKAVLEMLPQLGWQPDIIHCNDWQSGLIPLFLKTHYKDNAFYAKIATLQTIHNLFYQGNYPRETLGMLGLGQEYFHPDELEFYGNISFMKAGILYSDLINTVSRTYAKEIQTSELGEGMEGLLRRRSNDLYGIVNGINYHEFNPKTDPRIHRNYDAESLEHKKENQYALQREMQLPVREVPVLGIVTRLVDQKGLDLIAEISEELMRLDIQFVMLGSGDEHYHRLFTEMKMRHPQRLAVHIGFNPVLAQRIYAGSDMFLMPSRFEPCGLGQLIALRYGTVPIVRETGGLADTIREYDPVTGGGNGFVHRDYSGRELYSTIARALKLYREDTDAWQRLVRNGMEQDFSWARSAVEYQQLYNEAIAKRNGEHLMVQIA
ncbi:MAG: glycogen synthase GlgA [Firmicutes bacterium]|jgi:starch synthase|nr:glycogen synthase GlgA [Bacillota bacterium]MBU4532098.1 glycogen synthase GlgA [Bacillota bacterium]MBV1727225.1 glycogen synthase GlgA [Desulforudis sp.]MBV1736135.1 glycogen synthase GlgA [Desulforudis sp.]